MTKPAVIQIGYLIGTARREAVAINANLYREYAEQLGYPCRAIDYDGGVTSPAKLWRFLRNIEDECRQHPSVVIHDFFVMAGLSLLVMTYLRVRRVRVRYIKTFINPPGGGSVDKVGLLRLLLSNIAVYKTVARLADRVTYINPLDLANFVRLDAPLPCRPTDSIEPHRPVRVGYLGHPLRIKGVHLLPQIIEEVQESHLEDVEFRCSFTDRSDTHETLSSLGQLPNCKIEGVTDPQEFFGWADVYLLPIQHGYSASGSFNTVWEAMSRGCCVIVARVDHLPQILNEQNTCWADAPTIKGFTNALNDLIKTPEQLKGIQENALESYRGYYIKRDERVRKSLAKLYETGTDTGIL